MKPHYYVLRVGHKHPTVRHATPALAATEAERLAAQHPGDTFEVLQCLAITRTRVPSTFWLDGCRPEPAAATPPLPPEPGYIEITDPEEIIREGDEWYDGHRWIATRASVGVKAGDWFSAQAKKLRRPDPTRKVVPIPEEYLPLPPLPEGKTQWVGRGRFEREAHGAPSRTIRFWGPGSKSWKPTDHFSQSPFHIEAI